MCYASQIATPEYVFLIIFIREIPDIYIVIITDCDNVNITITIQICNYWRRFYIITYRYWKSIGYFTLHIKSSDETILCTGNNFRQVISAYITNNWLRSFFYQEIFPFDYNGKIIELCSVIIVRMKISRTSNDNFSISITIYIA